MSSSESEGTCRACASSSSSSTDTLYQSMTVHATDSPRELPTATPSSNLEPSTGQFHRSRDDEYLLRGLEGPRVQDPPTAASSQDTPRKRLRSDDGDEGEERSPQGSVELKEELDELYMEGEPVRKQREAKKQKRMASLAAASPSPAPKTAEAPVNPPKANSTSASTAVAHGSHDGDHPDKPLEEKPEEKPSKETTPSPSSDKDEVTPTSPASPWKKT